VLFTICHQVADIVHGLEVGADGFITKKADHEDLLQRIRAILADRRLGKRKAASRWKELKGLDALVMTQDRQQIIELLSTTFNQILHQRLRDVLGPEVTLMILQRAVRQVAQTHDIFRVKNSTKPTLAFKSEAIAQLPVKQIVAGFRALIAELFALLAKLAGRILVEQLKAAMEEELLDAQQ
jgi:response regulator RpfG family c-di-GMP phosphodiesterase